MKKTKGRPKGSEMNDSKALEAIADMLVANPTLKPTTALRRHNPNVGDAEKRRLQSKWKGRRESLLAAAESRLAVWQERRAISTGTPPSRLRLGAATEAARIIEEVYNSPTMRAMQAMREFQDSPTMRALRGIQDSPAMRAINEAQSSPSMRIIRDVYDSPSMRAARGISEAQEKLNRLLGGR